MKTKFKYLALMATALLVGFTSCSNDDDGGKPENSGAPKSMLLKITGETPSTYAEGPVQGATTVKFSSGTLYFVDGSGVIKGTKTIGAATAVPTPDIDIADVSGVAAPGKIIPGVDGSVTQVYIVGNTPATSLPASPTLISQVEGALLQVQSQDDIDDVNLFGNNVLTAPVSPATHYTCNVTLKPTVARVELTDMTVSGNYITGYEVAGIFVDNYYSQAAVNGAVLGTNLKDNSGFATAALANAAFTNGSSQYPNAPATASLSGAIYDWYATPLVAAGTPLKVAPTGAVWGYNVFATTAGSDVARIVIRLTGITTTADAAAGSPIYGGDQYITIKGYKNTATSTSVAVFKAGEVYNITGLSFNESNLTPIPSLATIDVEVKVSLVDWVPVGVTPEL